MVVVSKLWIFRSEAVCLLAISNSWPCSNKFSWHRLMSPAHWVNGENSNHRVWRWVRSRWVLSFSCCPHTVTLRGIAQLLLWLPWLKMASKETYLINQAIELDRSTRNFSIKSSRKTSMRPNYQSFPGQKGSVSCIFPWQKGFLGQSHSAASVWTWINFASYHISWLVSSLRIKRPGIPTFCKKINKLNPEQWPWVTLEILIHSLSHGQARRHLAYGWSKNSCLINDSYGQSPEIWS